MATLTIDVTPDLQARLEEVADHRGLPVPECARDLLAEALVIHAPTATASLSAVRAEMAARIRSIRGKYRHLPFTVDDFLRERREEAEREAERDRRWRGTPP